MSFWVLEKQMPSGEWYPCSRKEYRDAAMLLKDYEDEPRPYRIRRYCHVKARKEGIYDRRTPLAAQDL